MTLMSNPPPGKNRLSRSEIRALRWATDPGSILSDPLAKVIFLETPESPQT